MLRKLFKGGNYSKEETIQGRKLYEEIRYLLALGLHSLCYRRGEELKWFSPSVFIYLASVVPAIWVLELDAKRNEILCIYVDIVENTHDANREAMLMDLMQVRRTEYKFGYSKSPNKI